MNHFHYSHFIHQPNKYDIHQYIGSSKYDGYWKMDDYWYNEDKGWWYGEFELGYEWNDEFENGIDDHIVFTLHEWWEFIL